MKFVHFKLILCWFSVEVLCTSESITVKFLNKDILYVELGRTLVLEADILLQENDHIMFVTWERKNSEGEVRLARNNETINNRTFMEKNGKVLRIEEVMKSDYGIYSIIVTGTNGYQLPDSRQVRQITNSSTPSLAMKCSVLTQGAQWDRPRFAWQVDGVSITNETNELSEDGSSLRLIKLGRNYTCITDSSQGTGRVEVFMTEFTSASIPCHSSCCTTFIIFIVLLIIIVFILVAILIWMCCCKTPDSTAHGRDPGDSSTPLNEYNQSNAETEP